MSNPVGRPAYTWSWPGRIFVGIAFGLFLLAAVGWQPGHSIQLGWAGMCSLALGLLIG
jgi:hypothetical protein